MFDATHRHADGGLYQYIGPMKGKDSGEDRGWLDGVAYRNEEGMMFWTDIMRWESRFDPVQPLEKHTKTIRLDQDGEVLAELSFHVREVNEIRHMLVTAGPGAAKAYNSSPFRDHVKRVLEAQAEMVMIGLHQKDPWEFPNFLDDIESFHQKFGLEYLGKPRSLCREEAGDGLTLYDFRLRFMQEELDEYRDEQAGLTQAVIDGDHSKIVKHLDNQLDALIDLLYVALGTLYLQFGNKVAAEAWRRVQAANMAKIRATSEADSKRGAKVDVVKPKGWLPPSHLDLVADHAHVDDTQLEFSGFNQEA